MSASGKNISESHHPSHRAFGSAEFGIVTYRKGGVHGPRWQRDIQLVVLHRGSVEVRVDGTALEVRKGMGILLAPGHREEFRFSRAVEARHGWCQLAVSDVPDGMRFPAWAFHRPASCPARTLALLRLGLGGVPGGSEAGNSLAAASLALAAAWSFVAAMDERGSAPAVHDRALARFHAAVTELGAGKVTLADLARRSGVSRGHLIKLVRASTGVTPMEVVWRTRIARAARLLRETGLSVAEVADLTGFANAYHFSRRFRRQMGAPPRQWRTEAWDGK